MNNIYIGETISRIGLILVAVILVTIFVADTSKRYPGIRPQLIMAVLWRILILAFVLLWMIPYYVRESGGMDAIGYHYMGLRISDSIRHGDFTTLKLGLGTDMTRLLAGLLYVPFGGDLYGFFAVSAALAFVGMLLQFRAFCIWNRGRESKVYFMLLAFFPSYAMWAGLAGKDSWVALGLGMASLGYAQTLLRMNLRSLILTGAGLGLITIIRPHITLMMVAAIAIASLLGAKRSKRNKSTILLRIAVVICMLPLIYAIQKVTSSFVGMDNPDTESVLTIQSRVAKGNSYGGSALEAQTFNSLSEFLFYVPEGLTRVYLRPFLGEGLSANMLLAGLENAFLAVLIVWSALRLKLRYKFLSHPFALFAVMMTIELSILFCVFTNLGLLSRERAQLLPFFFGVVAIVLGKRLKKAQRRSVFKDASGVGQHTLGYPETAVR